MFKAIGKGKTLYKKYKKIKERQKHILAFRRGLDKKIVKNTILFESLHGKSIDGHIFHLVKDISERYKSLEIYVAVRNMEYNKKKLEKYNLNNVKLVKHLSAEYGFLLATCEVLVNDNTFYPFYSKRKGQKYFNIWHGTPLKTLGKDMEDILSFSNVQRNFLISDGIIVSNEYTKNILVKSHNIDNIYNGKVVVGPSPRNSILLDGNVKEDLLEEFGWNGKKIVMYMPTWRGIDGEVRSDKEKIIKDLTYLSNNLDHNTVLVIKPHTMQENIDISNFHNVYSFPENVELYHFLSCVDILITDYSSIMYDFLNTKRKIILYTYDKKEYLSTRGVYENIDEYPFIQVSNIEELAYEINNSNDIILYDFMKNKFCNWDVLDGSSIIADYMLKNKENPLIKEYTIRNEKENVFVFCGGLWDNGITTALLNTINSIDTSKRNYILIFGQSKLSKNHYFRLENLPPNVLYYPIPGISINNLYERYIHKKYISTEKMENKLVKKLISRIYEREFRRIFGDNDVDWFIHYTGFDRKYQEIATYATCKTMIFVHTDMFEDYKNKKNYNKKVLYNAYENTDKIILVNDQLKDKFVKELPNVVDKIVVANNFLGENRVRDLSNENIFSSLVGVNFDFVNSSKYNVNPFVRYEKEIKSIMSNTSEFYSVKSNRSDVIKQMAQNGSHLAKLEEKYLKSFRLDFSKIVFDNFVEEGLLNSKQVELAIEKRVMEDYLDYIFGYRNDLVYYMSTNLSISIDDAKSLVDNILNEKLKVEEAKIQFPYFMDFMKENQFSIEEEMLHD
ncbi:CDP-glycerol glycerophosphotransferase family protein [Heyndrickxia sporothermodurans]|uniref:CDP-glycerol glycerophosphotransferase family protein n=1 Tax=Heyndrickxia sporothermodurans TaxID=46224 RepID=UPI003D1CBB4E